MDKYICLKKSDVVVPMEGEEESSSDEDDEDDDEDEEDGEEDEEGTGDDPPDTAEQEPVTAEEEVKAGEEDVSDPFVHITQGLILGIGSTRQSRTVLGCVERHRSISRGCDQYSTSRRDVSDVLRQIS